MTDNEPTADELDQLAKSLAVDGWLGQADALRVVEVLRVLAAAIASQPRHDATGGGDASRLPGGSLVAGV
jgi:hypothetical protein